MNKDAKNMCKETRIQDTRNMKKKQGYKIQTNYKFQITNIQTVWKIGI